MATTPEDPENPETPDFENSDDDEIVPSAKSVAEPSFGDKVNQGKSPKEKWEELIKTRRKEAEIEAAKDKSKATTPKKPEPLHPKIDRKKLGIQTVGAERLLKDGSQTGALNELAAAEKYFKDKDKDKDKDKEKDKDKDKAHSEVVKLDKKTKIAIPRKDDKPVSETLTFSVIKGNDGQGKEELYALYRGKDEGLGGGTYGEVKIGQNIRTGEWVAVKIQQIEIPKALSKKEAEEVIREEKARIETEALAELAVGNGLSKFMVFNEKASTQDKPGYIKGYTILKLLPGMPLNKQVAGYIEEVEQDNRRYIEKVEQGNRIILAKMHEEGTVDPSKLQTVDPSKLKTVDPSKLISDPLEKLEVGILALEKLKEAHDKDVIHRDLKSHNIMYDRENKGLKIFDWGLAINLKTEGSLDPKTGEYTYSNIESIGSPPYMSPEISSSEVRAKQKQASSPKEGGKMNLREIRQAFIQEEGIKKEESIKKKNLPKTYVYSKKSDIYAMGIILRDEMQILENSLANAPYQEKLENLVASMTHDDPAERPSVDDAIEILKKIYEPKLKAQQKILVDQFFRTYKNLETHYKEGFFTKGKKKAYLIEIQTEVVSIKSDIENNRGLDLRKMDQLQTKIEEVQKKVSAERGNSENKKNINKLCTDMLQDLKALNRNVLVEVYAPPKSSIAIQNKQSAISATQKPEAPLSQKQSSAAIKPIILSKPARPERPYQDRSDLQEKVEAHLQNLKKTNALITHQYKRKPSEASSNPEPKPGPKPPKPSSSPPPLPPSASFTKPGKS